jgi:hypothetical protein
VARKASLSREEIKKELLKCGRDPIYFIKTYVRISHPLKGVIPFKLFDFQEECLDAFNNHRFNIILKGRQLGLSTTTAAYCVWLMLFHRSKEIMVVATKFKTAANLVKKVKAMIKRLPAWIRIANIEVDNQTSFILSNESNIQASTTSGDAGRSEALSLLVIDEAAHIEKLEDMWTALKPTLSTGGRCIALSSPFGVGNWFHKTYSEAEQGINDFNPIELMWNVHPERDQAWFDKETKNMSKRDIAQEHECNFNVSGETVFDPDNIAKIIETVESPLHRTGFDRNFWIWKECKPEYSHLMVCDTARGDGNDYSTFHIFRLETMEIIGEYQGKVPTDIFSNMINQVGREYGSCLVVVENNSVGYAVIKDLIDLEYPNLYWTEKSTHEYVEQIEAEHRSDCIPGFTMSLKTRPLIISKMEETVRNNMITIYSKRLLEEMKTFVWNNGRAEAMRTYHDDLVMACAIGCWIKDTALKISMRDLEYKKAFLGSIRSSGRTLNTTIGGMDGYAGNIGRDIEEHKSVMSTYPWLFTPRKG